MVENTFYADLITVLSGLMNMFINIIDILFSNQGFYALAGTIIGGCITFFTQTYMRKKEKEELRKTISAAFYSEVCSLLKLAKMRQYLEMLVEAIMVIDNKKTYPPVEQLFNFRFEDYFSVYRNNVKNIGILDPEIAPLLTEFYVNVFSLLEDLTTMPGSTYQKAYRICLGNAHAIYIRKLRHNFINDIILLHGAINIGSTICLKIGERYGLQYTNIFSELRPLNEILNELEHQPKGNKNALYNKIVKRILYNSHN